MKLFAAIDIGSYEVEMKIFQITSGKGIKEIDCVCHRMELGKDVYRDGKIGVEMTDELCRVSPFGYLRINGYLLLPEAFRSLSRPSSALSAKASTLRSFLFDLSSSNSV